MIKHTVAVLLTLLFSPLVFGQAGDGYVFFAPGQIRVEGDSEFGMHVGGGGRYISSSGVGFGAELGYAGPKDNFRDDGVGLFGPNGYYVFRTSNERTEPFVTGGYSRSFGNDFARNWGNWGAGLTHWAGARTGVVVEYRHYLHREEGINVQFWTIRIGFTFK